MSIPRKHIVSNFRKSSHLVKQNLELRMHNLGFGNHLVSLNISNMRWWTILRLGYLKSNKPIENSSKGTSVKYYWNKKSPLWKTCCRLYVRLKLDSVGARCGQFWLQQNVNYDCFWCRWRSIFFHGVKWGLYQVNQEVIQK